MVIVALYLIGPVVFFLFLRSLRGGTFRNAILLAVGMTLAALWGAYALALQPFTGDGRQDVYGLVGLFLWSVATLAGALRAKSRKKRADRLLAWGLGISLVILLGIPALTLFFY